MDEQEFMKEMRREMKVRITLLWTLVVGGAFSTIFIRHELLQVLFAFITGLLFARARALGKAAEFIFTQLDVEDEDVQ